MGVLQRFERRLEGMVGLAFARIFKGKVHPAEIAKALQREADEQRSVLGEGRVLAPNVYVVRLGRHRLRAPGPVVRPARRRARRHGRRAHRRRGLPGLRRRSRSASSATATCPPASSRSARTSPTRPGPPSREDVALAPPRPPALNGHPPLPPLPPLRGRVATDTGKQGPAADRRPRRLAPGVTHVLVVDGPGTRHELTTGRNVIGRGTEADIRLPDTGVSRKHVDVVLDGGDGDGRGPRLHQRHAGQRPAGQPACRSSDGDVIRIGHSVLVYRQDGA